MDKDNLLQLVNKDFDERKKILADLKQNLPIIIESFALTAQITKAKYDAFVLQGFTEEQALNLCKGS